MFGKFLKWLFSTGQIDELNLPLISNDLFFEVAPGTTYLLTQIDALDIDKFVRNYAFYLDDFLAFNKTVKEEYFWGKLIERKVTSLEFKEGNTFYIPSNEEMALLAFSNKFDAQEEAINQYADYKNSAEEKILKTAIKRASKTIGQHYGTESLIFLSPNDNLIGASESRVELINSEKQYKVNWGPDIWKCNIFVHDVVYDAGFEPDIMDNQHYITAGQLHQSEKFERLAVEVARPGILVQLYSGEGANQSHNLILTSFVNRINKNNGNELWRFKALGAEQDRAAVSFRKYEVAVIGNEYEILGARFEKIRFFKPKFEHNNLVIG